MERYSILERDDSVDRERPLRLLFAIVEPFTIDGVVAYLASQGDIASPFPIVAERYIALGDVSATVIIILPADSQAVRPACVASEIEVGIDAVDDRMRLVGRSGGRGMPIGIKVVIPVPVLHIKL